MPHRDTNETRSERTRTATERTNERTAEAGERARPNDAAEASERQHVFVEPSAGNSTQAGLPSKKAQGYGTAQGASGATSGGADAGGSLRVSPQADGASGGDAPDGGERSR